ncbi:MAG: HAMP domain-containing histidine kinase [Gammaproteobacteria bacterium]|nr:HAMP domain-containing histidine kinase [Gammaproteobacteria bacterium]
MATPIERDTGPRQALNWRLLGLLNLYRILVPAVLLGLYSLSGQRALPVSSPRVFFGATVLYLAFGTASVFAVRRRLATAYVQVILQATVDIGALLLILFACGGVASGLGALFLVPVGGLAFLLPPRSALFLAASAALAILLLTIWQQLSGTADLSAYATAGVLGAVLFTIAAAASFVEGRMRESEALVRQKDLDLANLAELSQYIVQHLRESLLVVDAQDRIRLINESAANILGDAGAVPDALLGEVSPRLLFSLSTWRHREREDGTPASFVAADGARLIQPHFAPLAGQSAGPTLIFLEDTSLMAERVQQSKLAALGRLSASIAHEIRNPVGAMSHAGQLLAESPAIGPDERRLTTIIQTNAERVSTIINNVLQLSRREATRPERLLLGEWLADFLVEFAETMQISEQTLRVAAETGDDEEDVEVRFDPSHLRQVVWNLCDNALKYGADGIDIRLGRLLPNNRPFLEVVDRGPGIDTQAIDRIFEPFFTGRKGGTGLGLFIARELAQLNRAVLLYEARAGGGSIFRIVFADPQRWEE